jgi:hypothetical protein
VRSSKGNWYAMVLYSFDCNYIKPLVMKFKSASELLKAFRGIFQELTSRVFKPKLQTMDNESSVALKKYFTENGMTYQLFPPHCKEHFIAGLSSVDPDLPMHLWDRLLPQTELTLNLLCTSRLHPQLSAAAHFHGLIDYNKTVFSPP